MPYRKVLQLKRLLPQHAAAVFDNCSADFQVSLRDEIRNVELLSRTRVIDIAQEVAMGGAHNSENRWMLGGLKGQKWQHRTGIRISLQNVYVQKRTSIC
ncbi:jg26668 [Pararge aegeria aegeria]|uniref:Jg26668 protein n=1 Tax=Pararge aegeria aegeria TaxID=348720 RepID=A0A8S4QDE0_9NEOP|nr:jg26668 [Pararge aegeria aegeria]